MKTRRMYLVDNVAFNDPRTAVDKAVSLVTVSGGFLEPPMRASIGKWLEGPKDEPLHVAAYKEIRHDMLNLSSRIIIRKKLAGWLLVFPIDVETV